MAVSLRSNIRRGQAGRFFALVATLVLARNAQSARAAIAIGSPMTDHMVVQRNKPVDITGTADANAAVTVHFADQTATATAGTDGAWHVTLKPMPAGGAV